MDLTLIFSDCVSSLSGRRWKRFAPDRSFVPSSRYLLPLRGRCQAAGERNGTGFLTDPPFGREISRFCRTSRSFALFLMADRARNPNAQRAGLFLREKVN